MGQTEDSLASIQQLLVHFHAPPDPEQNARKICSDENINVKVFITDYWVG